MVSFQCDACADTVKKPKLDQHRSRCFSSFTCLDCSKTFQKPSDYKGHTSCVSEAEKYQGALYKGVKKGQNQAENGPQSQSQSLLAATALLSVPKNTTTPTIHPSRLLQMSSFPSTRGNFQEHGRGGRMNRGGRGGFQGRGGYHAGGEKSFASSMNKLESTSGMRSWGSPVSNEISTSTPDPAAMPVSKTDDTGPKRHDTKRKKGDKGGTGSKANSKSRKGDDSFVVASKMEDIPDDSTPKRKKRKIDQVDTTPDIAVSASSKTNKRLKKRLAKLRGDEMTLERWVEGLGNDHKKNIQITDILKGVRVSLKDGSWILSV
ncbi:hypothetical protein L204_101537 [Cryptococcus depauperatus]